MKGIDRFKMEKNTKLELPRTNFLHAVGCDGQTEKERKRREAPRGLPSTTLYVR